MNSDDELHEGHDGSNDCLITVDDLKRWGVLPVPEWAKKPPRLRRKKDREQPTLFDDEP